MKLVKVVVGNLTKEQIRNFKRASKLMEQRVLVTRREGLRKNGIPTR